MTVTERQAIVNTYEGAATAQRVITVDSSGNIITSGATVITNAIDATTYDINGSAYNATTNISNDYILDNLELNFSTVQSKKITITTTDGTIIFEDTNSNKNLIVQFSKAFNANENLTVDVTQTSGACSMDLILKVREGSTELSGNPVLGTGSNVAGKVYITDGTDDVVVNTDGSMSVDTGATEITKGNINSSAVSDLAVGELLEELLLEMTLVRRHMELLTEELFLKEELED